MSDDWMHKATKLWNAVKEVNEQQALADKLTGDLEASRAALTMVKQKLVNAKRAEDDAYLEFCQREGEMPKRAPSYQDTKSIATH